MLPPRFYKRELLNVFVKKKTVFFKKNFLIALFYISGTPILDQFIFFAYVIMRPVEFSLLDSM